MYKLWKDERSKWILQNCRCYTNIQATKNKSENNRLVCQTSVLKQISAILGLKVATEYRGNCYTRKQIQDSFTQRKYDLEIYQGSLKMQMVKQANNKCIVILFPDAFNKMLNGRLLHKIKTHRITGNVSAQIDHRSTERKQGKKRVIFCQQPNASWISDDASTTYNLYSWFTPWDWAHGMQICLCTWSKKVWRQKACKRDTNV